MAKKYPSRYSNGKDISAAQYITEIICEKKAKLDSLDLHFRFWLNKKWSAFYKNQIATAYKLLKKYDANAIIRALNDAKSVKIYSLRAPMLEPIIEHHQKILSAENTEITKEYERKTDELIFGKKSNKKNIISKLKDIDNDN